MVNGVPLYTCLRDQTLTLLRDGAGGTGAPETAQKGRIFPKRLLDGAIRLPRLRRAKTVVFTSSVYRRDRGRNLACEYLMEKYPDTAVFEWPSRNEAFDSAYFSDPNRDRYCPLDFYLVRYKLARLLRKKRMAADAERIRNQLRAEFDAAPPPENENEAAAIRYLLDTLPESYAATELSQSIFRRMFRRYTSIRYAIDFWGSGRENIFPVLPGAPEKIELQHGLISAEHPGYIYPRFVKTVPSDFFQRKLLVYGEGTKRLLCSRSVFDEAQIEVVGNPRIRMYRRVFGVREQERSLILFTSQPFEQDGSGTGYYDTVIPYLKALQNMTRSGKYALWIKLHPRETETIAARYNTAIPDVKVCGAASELYELLNRTYIHITANSTTLYEAAEFGAPTITLRYTGYDPKRIFGNEVFVADDPAGLQSILRELTNEDRYNCYLTQLQILSKEFS